MNARVLLAEDDADHAFFTRRAFLEAHGETVLMITVRDGEEALDYLHRRGSYADAERPHLIVLDLKMPKVNGLEVLAAIKDDPELRTIPIVVLTSSDRPQDVQESYAGGANSYVIKAATVHGLREGVQDMARYWMDVARLPAAPA
ncbi:MAG: two-component response regulator [Frankiales bacterium]|nr:two-component response regulator [Frankiales bacterium]